MISPSPIIVSVLMPVRNAAATVARAVESRRAQTFADWELVAVDDGSTDGAREFIRGELGRRGYGEGRDFLICA